MNKILSFVMAALCVVMLGACSSDTPENPADGEVKYLTMGEVGVEVLSRMGLDSDVFEAGDMLGLYVYNTGTSSSGKDFYNVPATYDGTKWTIGKQIPVTSTNPIKVSAYYPYSEEAGTTSSTISPSCFSDARTNYKDLMLASCTPGSDAKINLGFRHSLIRVDFNLKLGADYNAGDGIVNGYRIESGSESYSNYIETVDLDSSPGYSVKYSSYRNSTIASSTFSDTDAPTLNGEDYTTVTVFISRLYTIREYYTTKSMNMYVTLDNATYTIVTDFDTSAWKAGYKYNFNVTFNANNTQASVVTTSIDPWGEGTTNNYTK